jgi:hypothetical protein
LHPVSKRFFTDRPVELRHVPSPIYAAADDVRAPRQAVWMRVRRPISDDPAVHRAALAYLSDLTIQESILRAHGVAWATSGLKVASLDHQVAHQLRVGRHGAHREHRRGRIAESAGGEGSRRHGEHPARRLQPDPLDREARGARKEDLQIFESLSVGESEGAAHLLLNYNP